MAFVVRVRLNRGWVHSNEYAYALLRVEDNEEVKELRRLLKRRNPAFTVSRLPRVESAAYHIEEMQQAELRAHPEALRAISEARHG